MVKCGIIDRKGSGSTRLILASGSRGRQEVLIGSVLIMKGGQVIFSK